MIEVHPIALRLEIDMPEPNEEELALVADGDVESAVESYEDRVEALVEEAVRDAQGVLDAAEDDLLAALKEKARGIVTGTVPVVPRVDSPSMTAAELDVEYRRLSGADRSGLSAQEIRERNDALARIGRLRQQAT